MGWLRNLKQKLHGTRLIKTRLPNNQFMIMVEAVTSQGENRCPVCDYLLSKNLEGTVEIKCRKCKNTIRFIGK